MSAEFETFDLLAPVGAMAAPAPGSTGNSAETPNFTAPRGRSRVYVRFCGLQVTDAAAPAFNIGSVVPSVHTLFDVTASAVVTAKTVDGWYPIVPGHEYLVSINCQNHLVNGGGGPVDAGALQARFEIRIT